MKSKTLFTALLITVIFLLAVVPFAEISQSLAQLPPPGLPEPPDQSPLWAPGFALFAALVYGAWKLKTRPKS